ncbi:MAG: DNA cytosine methyltransferase [Pseudomonadota bacterium]
MSEPYPRPRFAEFFCGGGLVRAALQAHWDCVFANDIDPMKAAVYTQNWGEAALRVGDIADLQIGAIPPHVDLYWASSPCQDFSLAGKGRGLSGARSGVFREWVRLLAAAAEQGTAPRIIAFENVTGLLTRNEGRDGRAVFNALTNLGYRVGALEVDAAAFVPQSRPRMFLVGVAEDVLIAPLKAAGPQGPFHSAKVLRFHESLPRNLARHWIWWAHHAPRVEVPSLADILDPQPDTPWLAHADVARLLSLMSAPSQNRVAAARQLGAPVVGMLYKRGRPDASGQNRQRAEVRFDGLAGCLRTPAGGSSRQTVLIVEGKRTRARLLSSLEAARLMGLPDSYQMPTSYNQAYKVAGDGVAVPVVRYLDQALFQPLLRADRQRAVA